MKSTIYFAITLLATAFIQFSLFGTAEAARVAVLPIQIDNDKVARASDFTSYYWDIVIEKLQYPDYELLDEENVDSAVSGEGMKSLDMASLQNVCNKTNAEIVIAMRLDEVVKKPDRNNREPKIKYYMKGEFAGYNGLTGQYYNKKINCSGRLEMALTYRNDWQKNTFTSTLKRCLGQLMKKR